MHPNDEPDDILQRHPKTVLGIIAFAAFLSVYTRFSRWENNARSEYTARQESSLLDTSDWDAKTLEREIDLYETLKFNFPRALNIFNGCLLFPDPVCDDKELYHTIRRRQEYDGKIPFREYHQ